MRPRPARRNRRRPADLTDPGTAFHGFPGFGPDAGVWHRPDHLEAPDAEPPPGPLERIGPVGSSAVAVLAVALLVGGLVAGFGHAPGDPSARLGPGPAASAVAAAGPAEAPAAATASAPAAPQSAAKSGDVVVLDQGRTPTAARALVQKLGAGGWRVTGTGAFHGNVPATTAYYPTGQEAAAKKLAAAFPEIRRVKPAFPGISQTKLVVIVVDTQNPPLVRKVLGTEAPHTPAKGR
ncbi:LytR C-terminal domain-containing protein [Yinghuangia aomiensis]